MVWTEDLTMSRTDDVHRVTENVYKVKQLMMRSRSHLTEQALGITEELI